MSKETENILRIIALIMLFGLIFIITFSRIRKLERELDKYKNAPADTVTIVKVDTLLYDNPQLIEQYESEKEKVAIEVRRLKKQLAAALNVPADTLEIHDTTTQLVYLPREYMVYKDTNYRAVVSGVQPRLDSLEIYQHNTVQTITKTVKVPDKKRWGFGVNVGAGYNGKEIAPYIGVGVQYNIFRW